MGLDELLLDLLMVPDEDLLNALTERILGVVDACRIVLFGSGARGSMGPDSDLDVLVVAPDGTHRRRTAQDIYVALWGLRVPIDIVVVTEADVDRYRDDPGLVLRPALNEGRELYRVA